MMPVFIAQWMKEKRSPFLVLMFFSCSILATFIFGGNIESKQRIGVFYSEDADAASAEEWMARMNQSEIYSFFRQEKHTALNTVREGRADVVVQLMEDDYRLISVIENHTVQLVDHHLRSVFQEELQLRAAARQSGLADAKHMALMRDEVAARLETPVLSVRLQTSEGEPLIGHNMGTQLLFAFSLFLAMFTIGMKVNQINAEKASGIWNRVILSPLGKAEQYAGHLLYASFIGFIQIAAVLTIFRYGFGFELGDRFDLLLLIAVLFTLTTVAFAILFTGVTRTPEQFLMIYPSVVPIIPLISGAYMPPGTITNPVLLTASELFPLSHAMEAMMGVALHNAGWTDIVFALVKMLLVGVLCMGIGMNLLERRA